MARKRSKPVADHVAAHETEVSEPTRPDSSATASTPAEPDIFDQVIAEREAGQFETPGHSAADTVAAPASPASERTAPDRDEAHGRENTSRTPVMPKINDKLPDPRCVDQISLEADTRKGTKMRLLRSYRHHDVWVQFDKNPGKDITEQVKAEGFRWEPQAEVGDRAGAWVKPLEPGREVRIMLDAERLFKDVANQIRGSNGLEPVGMAGVGAG